MRQMERLRQSFFCPGIPDELFLRGDAPMTKQEIRALTMMKASITPSDTVYDIGAGTGSLSVEAAILASHGKVISLERDEAAVSLIQQNLERFSVEDRVQLIHGEASVIMKRLPQADVILIGGSGGHLKEILLDAKEKLRPGGRIVVNAIALETAAETIAFFRKFPKDFSYQMIQVQVQRFRAIGAYDMAQALNPIYILTGIYQGG